jgi:hypothetical protein
MSDTGKVYVGAFALTQQMSTLKAKIYQLSDGSFDLSFEGSGKYAEIDGITKNFASYKDAAICFSGFGD